MDEGGKSNLKGALYALACGDREAAALFNGLGFVPQEGEHIVAQFAIDTLHLHRHGRGARRGAGQQKTRCQQESRFHRSDMGCQAVAPATALPQ